MVPSGSGLIPLCQSLNEHPQGHAKQEVVDGRPRVVSLDCPTEQVRRVDLDACSLPDGWTRIKHPDSGVYYVNKEKVRQTVGVGLCSRGMPGLDHVVGCTQSQNMFPDHGGRQCERHTNPAGLWYFTEGRRGETNTTNLWRNDNLCQSFRRSFSKFCCVVLFVPWLSL